MRVGDAVVAGGTPMINAWLRRHPKVALGLAIGETLVVGAYLADRRWGWAVALTPGAINLFDQYLQGHDRERSDR